MIRQPSTPTGKLFHFPGWSTGNKLVHRLENHVLTTDCPPHTSSSQMKKLTGRRTSYTEILKRIKEKRRDSLPRMDAFARLFKPKRQLLVGRQGISFEDFLSKPAPHWPQ